MANTNEVKIYIHFNQGTNNPPKLWACNDEGDLLYGSVHKTFTFKLKDKSYHAKNAKTKMKEGYCYVGYEQVDFLIGEGWRTIRNFWTSEVNQMDIDSFNRSSSVQRIIHEIITYGPVGCIYRLNTNLVIAKSAINVKHINSLKKGWIVEPALTAEGDADADESWRF